MNLQFYLEKLFASEKFQNFIKKNPSAYFCSGFFSIDKENKGNKIHIDYIIPETKKIFSFQVSAPKGLPSGDEDINPEGKVDVIPVEQIGDEFLKQLSDNIDFDFEEIEKMIVEKMDEQKIKSKIQKILLSLQKIDTLKGTSGKIFLVGTVFISGLGMIKIKIDLEENKIVEFEKKSFFDMMKIVKK